MMPDTIVPSVAVAGASATATVSPPAVAPPLGATGFVFAGVAAPAQLAFNTVVSGASMRPASGWVWPRK